MCIYLGEMLMGNPLVIQQHIYIVYKYEFVS